MEMLPFALQATIAQRVQRPRFPVVLVPTTTYLNKVCVLSALLDSIAHLQLWILTSTLVLLAMCAQEGQDMQMNFHVLPELLTLIVIVKILMTAYCVHLVSTVKTMGFRHHLETVLKDSFVLVVPTLQHQILTVD